MVPDFGMYLCYLEDDIGRILDWDVEASDINLWLTDISTEKHQHKFLGVH
jgi:hypothetical protein